MATHSSNEYLSMSEMIDNAQYIINYFQGIGWTDNAIAGMLGNMQRESTINPGLWQNMDEGNTSLGLGLVQWTPASKLINWCDTWGLDYLSLEAQCKRIYYELENGIQYYPTDDYPETFEEYTKSTKSVEYLTTAFLKNYERAGVEALDERIDNAEYWAYYIEHWVPPDDEDDEGGGGGGGDDPGTPTVTPTKKKKKGYKFYLFNRRRLV